MKFGTPQVGDLDVPLRGVRLLDGEVLVREGDEADDVYVISSGELVATTHSAYGDVIVGRIGEGHVVGEVTVIAGGRRTATLTASGPAEVQVIRRSEFEQWLEAHPDIADAVSAQARERIDRTQVAAMVSDLLGARDPVLVQDIVERVQWRRLEAGDVLFEQGEKSDAAYFIVGGRLMVSVKPEADGGGDRAATEGDGADFEGGDGGRVAELGRGDVVGELGLLDDAPRSATVRAVRDSTLATLTADMFEELVIRSPALMLHVARGVISRLRTQPRRSGRAASLTVAVTAPLDPGPLLDAIVTEIARFGSVRHLSSERVDRILNRHDISQATADNVGVPRLSELMHEADVGNDHVVLETDPGLTGWTRRSLRQADRVLLIVSPDPDAEERQRIGELVGQLDGVEHVRRMVAIVHPATADRPRATDRLLAEVGGHEVVHLRAGRDDHVRRLARLASGHGVGLVLSGGGARGFAHLGALRALRESGVPVDAVGGCSMGAPIAGGVALDLDDAELIALAEKQFHRLLDYTLPVVALLKGQRISRNIDDNFGTFDIEDLWLPFYCVSTNLTTSRLHVHRRGSSAVAIRASVAIPGVLPPVPFEGDLLVDGGVLNNLPVQVMRTDSTIGTVIAVDVAPQRGPRARSDFGHYVSGVRALRSTVGRSASDFPSVSSVLLRSMLTGAVHNQQRSLRDGVVDLLLQLDLPGVGLLDFERVQEVAQIGYDDALVRIREWAATQPWCGGAG
ncbi:MAG: cyclic nucleotide-binding domain-containing protein [Ilumatobacteraceae bacterium]